MKKMKKVLSLILTVIMVLAMAVPSFADTVSGSNETNGTITINEALPGETYKIYKIFDLESYSYEQGAPEDGQYSYTITLNEDDDWYSFFTEIDGEEGTGAGLAYVTLARVGTTNKYYVTWNAEADEEEFAAAVLNYIDTNAIETTESEVAPLADAGETTSTVKFDGLDLGYYLVDLPVGALCALNTTNPDAEITEKNTAPTIEKQVKDDDNTFGSENNAQIGDTVNFKITIHAKEGAENYVLHDKLSAGLDLNTDADAFKVTVNNEDLSSDFYTVTTEDLGDNCSFEISFANDYLKTITQDTDIVVEYSAVLNESAVIYTNPNTNEAKLDYGDIESTTWNKTETYTFSFDVVKTDTAGKLLAGAEFELYDAETLGNKINLVKVDDYNYRVASADEIEEETFQSAVIRTMNDGKITVKGLDSKQYWLDEIKTPEGYNALAGRALVNLTDETNLSTTMVGKTWQEGDGGVHVINNTGTLLPSTGGIGTTIFYAAGIVLMAGAVFFVVRRKRA